MTRKELGKLVAACWILTSLIGLPIALVAHQYAPLLGLGIGSIFYTAVWAVVGLR